MASQFSALPGLAFVYRASPTTRLYHRRCRNGQRRRHTNVRPTGCGSAESGPVP